MNVKTSVVRISMCVIVHVAVSSHGDRVTHWPLSVRLSVCLARARL